MSDIMHMPANTLAQRLQSAEKSIQFIQREHALTLANLHEEIAKWQQKCSELTFQLAIGGGTVVNSTDDSKLRGTIEQLENEIRQHKETMKNLNKILEEKEKSIKDYENRLVVSERKHALDLHAENNKQRQLKTELEQRSTIIAQLTNQLHQQKQAQQQLQTRTRLGKIILPNKPPKIQSIDIPSSQQQQQEQQQHSLSNKNVLNRSSSLNTRVNSDQDLTKVSFAKRRPPTPPQQLRPLSSKSIEFDDEQNYTKRQRQLLNSHAENVDTNKVPTSRPSVKLQTILPPIINRNMPLKALPTTTVQQEGEA
ncbi:unnamed protein product [Adineta steineri]|uniref:CCDC92/74 N-terminal domain-containing protein n=1 Tax=Adineta steineri TaxID=433720 RepID=A0A815S405_9BILA|nr:unnamed protein product [Adineta steineri]